MDNLEIAQKLYKSQSDFEKKCRNAKITHG